PQKRNPMACEAIVGICRLLRTQSSLGFESMVQEHERDMGPWQAEWEFIPEMFMLTAGALHHMSWILERLIIYPENMKKNLEKSNGLIMSESVMMKLAQKIGRQKAHDLVYKLAMNAFQKKESLENVLMKEPEITKIISKEEIKETLNPLSYTGLAQEYVSKVIR